uniref:phosphatidylinositol-3,5-bisphosphate 3-phosphatase n=1 Tax=Phlebotomus papatasi TaxID=29031 RepID=A0A1B0CYX5_PHLPP
RDHCTSLEDHVQHLTKRISNLKNLISKSARRFQGPSMRLKDNKETTEINDNRYNYDKKSGQLTDTTDHPLNSTDFSFSNLSYHFHLLPFFAFHFEAFWGVETCEQKTPTMSGFLSSLESSGWLKHIRSILDTSNFIACAVDKGISVVVHCSDGWDRTAQVCSLAALILDPFYRTIKGFQALIEKDWLAFGHKFSERCGYIQTDPKEMSPVFTQFLDSTWQLVQQRCDAFEFNERFLLTLHDHVQSCQFGTFIGNCEKDRLDLRLSETTFSLWGYMANHINECQNIKGRFIYCVVENVRMIDRYNSKNASIGTLYLTATHLIFVDPEANKETWILHMHIATIDKLPLSTTGSPLLIRCKTFLSVTFVIPKERECHDVYVTLQKLCQPVHISSLYCFHYTSSNEDLPKTAGWDFFRLETEFKRMRVPNEDWSLCTLNTNYELCDTYPRHLYVPSEASTAVLMGSSRFRSKGRLPALTYLHSNRASICRCSQPLSGFSARCLEDEQMLEAIRKTNPNASYMYVISETNCELQQINAEMESVAVDWKSMRNVTVCSCSTPFDQFSRKNHCWKCGEVFCSRCIVRTVPLAGHNSGNPVPVCRSCFRAIQQTTP